MACFETASNDQHNVTTLHCKHLATRT